MNYYTDPDPGSGNSVHGFKSGYKENNYNSISPKKNSSLKKFNLWVSNIRQKRNNKYLKKIINMLEKVQIKKVKYNFLP